MLKQAVPLVVHVWYSDDIYLHYIVVVYEGGVVSRMKIAIQLLDHIDSWISISLRKGKWLIIRGFCVCRNFWKNVY